MKVTIKQDGATLVDRDIAGVPRAGENVVLYDDQGHETEYTVARVVWSPMRDQVVVELE